MHAFVNNVRTFAQEIGNFMQCTCFYFDCVWIWSNKTHVYLAMFLSQNLSWKVAPLCTKNVTMCCIWPQRHPFNAYLSHRLSQNRWCTREPTTCCILRTRAQITAQLITCKCVDFLHIGSKLGRVFLTLFCRCLVVST